MITKDNIRAIYKPDAETKDGILYFYPKEVDGGETLMWVCEKDEEIKYFFDVPFLDDNWEIQKKINVKSVNGIEVFEGDKILIQYREFDCGDIIQDEVYIFIDDKGVPCIKKVGRLDDCGYYINDFFSFVVLGILAPVSETKV